MVVLKRLNNTPTPTKRAPKKIEDHKKTEEVSKEMEEVPLKLNKMKISIINVTENLEVKSTNEFPD